MVSKQPSHQLPHAGQVRSQKTRERLLYAGAVEIAEFGYENTTVGRICRAAGATSGALYAHFPSKWAVAEEILRQQQVRVEELAHHVGATLPAAFDRLLCFSSDLAELIMSAPSVRAGLQLSTDPSLPPHRRVWEHWAFLADALETSAHSPTGSVSMPPRLGTTSIALLVGAWLMTRDRTEPHFEGLLRQFWVHLAQGAANDTDRASATASVEIIFGREARPATS